jgi:hypothetical protein
MIAELRVGSRKARWYWREQNKNLAVWELCDRLAALLIKEERESGAGASLTERKIVLRDS